MEAEIRTLGSKKFIGMMLHSSFTANKTFELWSKFMPRKKEIINVSSKSLYSIERYPGNYFEDFKLSTPFEKWAALEVSSFEDIPENMKCLTSPEGEYAVFIHRGTAADGPKTYQKIFTEWLPDSNFILDDRPHFAIMGEKYKHDSPDSEEEIWIPVKEKS